MTSPNHQIGDTVYIPFWIALDYWDDSPPTAFFECRIVSIEDQMCQLTLGKDDLIAPDIPLQYLITPGDLPMFQQRIADWFLNYPATKSNATTD